MGTPGHGCILLEGGPGGKTEFCRGSSTPKVIEETSCFVWKVGHRSGDIRRGPNLTDQIDCLLCWPAYRVRIYNFYEDSDPPDFFLFLLVPISFQCRLDTFATLGLLAVSSFLLRFSIFLSVFVLLVQGAYSGLRIPGNLGTLQ